MKLALSEAIKQQGWIIIEELYCYFTRQPFLEHSVRNKDLQEELKVKWLISLQFKYATRYC